MQFVVQGTLAKVTIKPPKDDESGPKAVIQVEVDVTRDLGGLNLYVGTGIEVTIETYQQHMDEALKKLASV